MEEAKNIVVLYKNKGKFYNTVGLDSYIMNYLFGYKVLKDERCGFPDVAIDSVRSKLDSLMISYQIVYSDRNPLIVDFKNKNEYNIYAQSAKSNCILKRRIESIYECLNILDNEKAEDILTKIEKILNNN